MRSDMLNQSVQSIEKRSTYMTKNLPCSLGRIFSSAFNSVRNNFSLPTLDQNPGFSIDTMNVTKADVDKPFKLNGLFLAPDASAYLLQIAQRVDSSKRQKVLRRIVETILKQKIDETRITKTLCEQAVNECKADRSVDNPVLYVIDAFEVPRFHYSKSLKKFIPLESTSMNRQMDSIFPASAQAKAFLYAHRYEVVHQRVLRHQLFSQTSANGSTSLDGSQMASYRIRPIEYLLASGSKIDSVIVLGMLCQLREGDWHLEDPTGIVRLNLSQAVFHECNRALWLYSTGALKTLQKLTTGRIHLDA
ncbi:hypothetical protein EG68_11421 [Paragonimus skrjabini miyazakii]|uniref:DNA polymerase epsilon subunit B N-terminal domain-containing protein n=1 Tax=Paragonimus skrjabini miyazakii TaxID=59628 RepID=A0A8S9YLP4_9TREM|nr:hypothetical protein EG68_11421 [Paragonimus skrjabini miyazakii]